MSVPVSVAILLLAIAAAAYGALALWNAFALHVARWALTHDDDETRDEPCGRHPHP